MYMYVDIQSVGCMLHTVWRLYFMGLNLPMGVTAQWLKFSLNKFRERFQIPEILEIKDPRNINAIRYVCMLFTENSL